MWQQICIHEHCKDDQCGHEICGEVQWMMKNTFNSKFIVTAHSYWTLVTAAFSHIGSQNLLINTLALAMFAPASYTAGGVGIGAFHIMGLTFGSAIFGNLTGLVHRWNEPLDTRYAAADDIRAYWSGAGASGVASAFATAATYLTPWHRFTVGRFTTPVRIYWVTIFIVFSDLMALVKMTVWGVHHAGAALASYTISLPSEGRVEGGELLIERKTERSSSCNDITGQDDVEWWKSYAESQAKSKQRACKTPSVTALTSLSANIIYICMRSSLPIESA